MHATLRIIRDEHSSLSAVLRSIGLLLSESRRHGLAPDFQVLRAMLFYIDEYPEKVHHTKESALLFPKIRARSAEAASVHRSPRRRSRAQPSRRARSGARPSRARNDERGGERAVAGAARFEEATHAYIAGYLDHMRTEEVEILPLAERVLTVGRLGRARRRVHAQPRSAHPSRGDDAFRPLFKRILMTLSGAARPRPRPRSAAEVVSGRPAAPDYSFWTSAASGDGAKGGT